MVPPLTSLAHRLRALADEVEELAKPRGATMIVDFPWDEHPAVYCYECGAPVPTVLARVHGVTPDGFAACEARFVNISTQASKHEWKKKVAAMRPDLKFVELRN